jgi:ribosomal protein S18 acetylase RimI-like enzyme
VRPATDDDWRKAWRLVEELRAWDLGQSRAIGLDTRGVASTFYPGDADEVRRWTSPPAGCFLTALDDGQFAGCASFRALEPGACEMHDVYVRPAFRGRGIGAQLVERLIEEARGAGYDVMRLETATFMTHAHALYAAQGFRVREPYRTVPAELAAITIWMERSLRA